MGLVALTVGDKSVPVEDALQQAVGYAFAIDRLKPKAQATGHVGDPLAEHLGGRWAYRTYDCIPADPGSRLGHVDLLVASGLNGRLSARKIASLIAVEPEVSDALELIPPGMKFWELTAEDVSERPSKGDPAWPVWRAWSVLMGVPHVDVAVTHKTLHHKRPSVFPLLDNLTIAKLDPQGAWRQIHDELTMDPDDWRRLEQRFASVATHFGGRQLTRLRLHDILLWLFASKSAAEAADRGRALLVALDDG